MEEVTKQLDDTSATNTDTSKTEEETKGTENEQTQTLSDLLKDEKLSAEHNALVQEAVNIALKTAKEEQEKAAKLAKMSDTEKEELKKNELAAKEKALVERELKLDAFTLLGEKKLPSELSNILDYSDANKMKASVDIIEDVFNKAVASAVESKLSGGAALKKAPDKATSEDVDVEAIRKAIAGNY